MDYEQLEKYEMELLKPKRLNWATFAYRQRKEQWICCFENKVTRQSEWRKMQCSFCYFVCLLAKLWEKDLIAYSKIWLWRKIMRQARQQRYLRTTWKHSWQNSNLAKQSLTEIISTKCESNMYTEQTEHEGLRIICYKTYCWDCDWATGRGPKDQTDKEFN